MTGRLAAEPPVEPYTAASDDPACTADALLAAEPLFSDLDFFAVMTGEYGPFSKCSPDRRHDDTTTLPTEPAPAKVLVQLRDFEVRRS